MLPVGLALFGCETLDTPNPTQRYFPRCIMRHQLPSSWPIVLRVLDVCYALSSTLCAHHYRTLVAFFPSATSFVKRE